MRERILAGAYSPGSALRQDNLASEFGISKIPVREALVQLQSEGLVTIYPNRGFQVRPLVITELQEVFSLRLQIEPAAVAIGAKLAGSADHLAAHKALQRLNAALAAKEFSSSGQLNRAFHLQLVVPRLQPIAAEILGRLHTLAQRYVQAHLQPQGRVKRASREHAQMLKIWCAGRSRDVREAMHRHIESTREDLERAVATQPKTAGVFRHRT
jgi:DNA-binding GntR family transcriptional regulator